MTDFKKVLASYQSTEEERQCSAILFSDIDIQMNDSRLNHLGALTYNMQSCERLFVMVEKAIDPYNNPWKTIYKALLIIHTFIMYGSELAVDKCISLCKYVHPLQTYNSALVKKGWFSTSGGTDFGAPVRATANIIVKVLMNDQEIRKARQDARQGHNILVPLGQSYEQHNPQKNVQMGFGQAVATSVGAGFNLEEVPGMYEGRPERYFDNANDPRSRPITGNHQLTRDALAPSLLDLAFDDESLTNNVNSNLPPVDYLPALERQKELERQLAEQQELLRKLQEQQHQQLQQQNHIASGGDLLSIHHPQNHPQFSSQMNVLSGYNNFTSPVALTLQCNGTSGNGFPISEQMHLPFIPSGQPSNNYFHSSAFAHQQTYRQPTSMNRSDSTCQSDLHRSYQYGSPHSFDGNPPQESNLSFGPPPLPTLPSGYPTGPPPPVPSHPPSSFY